MSYSRQYFFDADGKAVAGDEYRNGHGYCIPIWTYLADKYIAKLPGEKEADFYIRWWMTEKCAQVWAFATDPRLERWERITLLASFDHYVAKRENFNDIAEAFEKCDAAFKEKYRDHVCHYAAMAAEIRKDGAAYQAVGWYGTSVSDSLWWVYDECECAKCGDTHQASEGRPYDLTKDDKHFVLFEDECLSPIKPSKP